jgi:hypothetical protein
MWSVRHRDGALLTANDLLRGEKVRPMAQGLVRSWDTIAANAVEGAQLVRDRGFLFGTHYRSLNVLTLLLAWRLLGRQWLAAHPLVVTVSDGFEKSLDCAFKDNCDRWILMSQWSGRWGKSTDKAFADYVRDLANDWATIVELTGPDDVVTVLKTRMETWITALQAESSKYVDDLAVLMRNRVHDYYLPLWLWHRLDAQRWRASAIPLRESKKGSLIVEVDHVVAVRLWYTLPGAQLQADDEDALSDDDLSTAMNALGNCCLLEKSFNIAKGAQPLAAFLERVHDFKPSSPNALTADGWAKDLGIDPTLVNPVAKSASEVRTVVEARTAAMKAELTEYLGGTRQRADV